MIYHLSLQTAGICAGIFLLLISLPALLMPEAARNWIRSVPRSFVLGAALLTIALIWSQVVEGLLVGFLPEVGRWLPGGAASALAGVETPNGGMLPMWAAAVVLAAYGLAFAAAGAAALARRDVA